MRLPFLAAGSAQPRPVAPLPRADFNQAQRLEASATPGVVRAVFAQEQRLQAGIRPAAAFSQSQRLRASPIFRAGFRQSQTMTGSGSVGLWPNGFRYQHEVRLRAWPGGGTPVDHFLLPFSETLTAFKAVANGGEVEHASGYDIRFETTGGTKLGHILIGYNGTTGAVLALVNMPRDFAAAQSIYCYTGKSGISATEESASDARAGGWLAWFKGGSVTDLTGQGRDLTATGTPGSTTLGGWPAYDHLTSGDYLGGLNAAGFLNGLSAVSAVALFQSNNRTSSSGLFNVSTPVIGTELGLRQKADVGRLVVAVRFDSSTYLYETSDNAVGDGGAYGGLNYALPDQPIFEGPTYYVSPTSSAGPSTNPSARGGLRQTIQGVNDGSIIVCASGAYAGFSTEPKSGQQGRIKIIAENPVVTGTDVSSIDGLPIGYNASGSHATLSEAITLDNFGGVWVEGFKMGKFTSPNPVTNARWLIGHRSGATGWYVRNYHYNVYTQQCVHDGPGSVVCYQNVHTADGYNMYGVADYTSDYGVFATNLQNLWVSQCIFRGVMSKPVSMKQNIINGYVYDNVMDFAMVVGGKSAAYLVMLGQVSDAEIKDNTIGYARVAYNKLRIGATGVVFMSSNVATALIEENEITRAGGTPQLLQMDAIDEKYPDGVTTYPCCQRDSRHPTQTTLRNNTIYGGAANWRWAMGKTWVKSTAPNGRTKLLIEQNTVVGGGTIAALPWNAGFPDGVGSFASRGANSTHTGDEPIEPTFGANPGLAPMS